LDYMMKSYKLKTENILTKQVQFIQVSGRVVCATAKELCHGRMEPSTKVIGCSILPVDRENLRILMAVLT